MVEYKIEVPLAGEYKIAIELAVVKRFRLI
jgi:hypothetical protein